MLQTKPLQSWYFMASSCCTLTSASVSVHSSSFSLPLCNDSIVAKSTNWQQKKWCNSQIGYKSFIASGPHDMNLSGKRSTDSTVSWMKGPDSCTPHWSCVAVPSLHVMWTNYSLTHCLICSADIIHGVYECIVSCVWERVLTMLCKYSLFPAFFNNNYLRPGRLISIQCCHHLPGPIDILDINWSC